MKMLASIFIAVFASPLHYSAKWIDCPRGFVNVRPLALNDHGVFVVSASKVTGSDIVERSFRIKDHRYETYPKMPDYPSVVVTAINNQGDYAGYYGKSYDGGHIGERSYPFVYQNKHPVTILRGKVLDDGQALAMSERGAVAGLWNTDSGYALAYVCQGFLFADGRLRAIGPAASVAMSTNGLICGYTPLDELGRPAPDVQTVDSRYRSFIVDGKGRHDIGPGRATAINNSGFVVGYMPHNIRYSQGVTEVENPEVGADMWSSKGGKRVQVGFLKWLGAMPTSVNDSNTIVGDASVANGLSHGFVVRNGTAYDLNEVIDPKQGWIITHAKAVNRSGQILCQAESEDGESQVGLLTPPKK